MKHALNIQNFAVDFKKRDKTTELIRQRVNSKTQKRAQTVLFEFSFDTLLVSTRTHTHSLAHTLLVLAYIDISVEEGSGRGSRAGGTGGNAVDF